MINLTREVDLPYILDKFKKIEPVQNVDYSDIPADMDDKTRAIYHLVIDAISNAKKFASYEIENVSDILNNFISQIYTEFAEINTVLSSDDSKNNFKESLDKSVEKISENLIISNEVEKTQTSDIEKLQTSVKALKDLVLSLKESYEKYVSSIVSGFKDEFEAIEKKFESLIDSKLSKEFSDNKSFNNKIDNAFKNNAYIKKILEKFNAQYLSSLKGMIPAQISIISDKMKREIDAEKERMLKEKNKGSSIRQLFKKYGLLGGTIAIGINTIPTRKQLVSSFKSIHQFSIKTIENIRNIRNIKIKDTIRNITDINRIKKSIGNIASLAKARAIRIGKNVSDKLKSGAYYLIDNNFKTINRDFGLVGVAAGVTAKGLYSLFGGKRQTAYMSVKNKPKKTKATRPDFKKFEIDKKSSTQELIFKIYDFSEIIRLNLISFNTDIVEAYNARNKLSKERKKDLKKKELSNMSNKYGLLGALIWLLRPLLRFLGRKIGHFISKIKTSLAKRLSNFWKSTRLGKWLEYRRVSRLAKKLMRKYPGLSKARALKLAKNARLSKAASKAVGKTTGKAIGRLGLRSGAKIFGAVIAPVINLAIGIIDSNNKKYMSGIYGVAEYQITSKHQVSFALAATVAGGTSILDDSSWGNWLNLGFNMWMWFEILGPVGVAVGAIFNLIGQERIARFMHSNPYASLGIAVSMVSMHPAIVAATGGLSVVVGLGAVGLGFAIDRLTNKNTWKTATGRGQNIGLIAGMLGGAVIGLKAGAFVGSFVGGPIGTVIGAAAGLVVGAAISAIGFVVGGLIGSLFEDEEEPDRPLIEEMKERMLGIMHLNTYKYNRAMLTLKNKKNAGLRDDAEDEYSFGNLWNGIASLQKINGYLTSDVRLLLSKNTPIAAGANGVAVVPISMPASTLNNPANEAAEQDARLEQYRRAGPTPRIGPRRDW